MPPLNIPRLINKIKMIFFFFTVTSHNYIDMYNFQKGILKQVFNFFENGNLISRIKLNFKKATIVRKKLSQSLSVSPECSEDLLHTNDDSTSRHDTYRVTSGIYLWNETLFDNLEASSNQSFMQTSLCLGVSLLHEYLCDVVLLWKGTEVEISSRLGEKVFCIHLKIPWLSRFFLTSDDMSQKGNIHTKARN